MASLEVLMGEILGGENRFKSLLNGVGTVEYDRPLFVNERWIVAPTLGAIIPGWLLVIPRRPVLNFARWSALEAERPECALDCVREHLGLSSDEIIWFEHGPKSPGTTVGCGLDHAHIHILIRPPFTFETFEAAVRAESSLSWSRYDAEAGYASLPNGRSYLIAGSAESVIAALDVDGVGSQFFRRVVGGITAQAHGWDYRTHPHSKNIASTISTFRSLESTARRDR